MTTAHYRECAKAAKTYAAQEALKWEVFDESARVIAGTRFDYKGARVQAIRLSVVLGATPDAPVEVWYTVALINAQGMPSSRSQFTVTAEEFERHASNVGVNI